MTNGIISNEKYSPISPFREISAYEALWRQDWASYKKLSELFSRNPGLLPSELVSESKITEISQAIRDVLTKTRSSYKTNFLISGTLDYPKKLNDAREKVELLYFSGNINYIRTKSIAVVGTRNPTPQGIKRTAKLVKMLVHKDLTIVSGLAQGIDTAAHNAAIENGGRTIGVLGTPLNVFYPKTNKELQIQIANDHLLISQVPFIRYSEQSVNGNRFFFPERNKTMSALTEATVIVEAGETSGTLVQAKAALDQGRKLFILESNFQNDKITWPEKFLKRGAIKVKEFEDILNALSR
ncbi:DNA-processing protein DprA [Dyadobacter chenhuakuii]|uniref:DNA-protecting protein DprA n=1 Tax=Dyadobacter chenhuakuii TaxID=2909339 RepID=A0A9X1QJN7_9BACT|nr:DNA-processing protein DprA [Dyadobacter chenhuakuii]MCF2501687.1 DNA-protecting protein DprA [Dyadobacter chenhuakuii]